MNNRELKFRAWDNSLKKFKYPELWDSTMPRNWKDWYDLQQFTGLKDKNGKDIYEKDVCKILYTDWISKSNDDPRTIEQYMDDIAKIGVIEYSQDGFYFVTKDRYGDDNYSHIFPGTHGFIKVIGNIYENPELLTPLQ